MQMSNRLIKHVDISIQISEENRDGSRNAGLLADEPPDAASSPRKLYSIQQP